MDSNGYPDDTTFAIRLRQIFFELARHEENLALYEAAAMPFGAPRPTCSAASAAPTGPSPAASLLAGRSVT